MLSHLSLLFNTNKKTETKQYTKLNKSVFLALLFCRLLYSYTCVTCLLIVVNARQMNENVIQKKKNHKAQNINFTWWLQFCIRLRALLFSETIFILFILTIQKVTSLTIIKNQIYLHWNLQHSLWLIMCVHHSWTRWHHNKSWS